MDASDDQTEDDRILAFKAKVDAQTFQVRTLDGSIHQKAQDQKVLDLMRQNEAQAIMNRALSRNADDPLDIEGVKAAE